MSESGGVVPVVSRQRPSFKDAISDREVEELLGKLISISSVNPFGREEFSWPPYGEAKIAEFVGDYMQGLGLKVEFQEVLPGRPNVIVTMEGREGEGALQGTLHGSGIAPRGSRVALQDRGETPQAQNERQGYGGRAGSRALLLEAHMDTVQVENMAIDPFIPKVEGGRLFGRGACDDKSSLAAMMLALKLIKESDYTPEATVYLAAVADEEYKFRGVRHLLESGIRADAGIVGEPTDLDVVIAHKGCVRWRIITRGKAVHSSRPEEGVNAIHKMADVIVGMRRKLEPLYDARRHPLVGTPTLSVGLISGGVGVNTVPDECTIHIDRRLLPGEKADEVLQEFREVFEELKAQDPSLDVRMEEPYLIDIPVEISAEEPVVRCLVEASQAVLGDARIKGVPYGTDASKIAASGIPSVVFGPGSIVNAHSPSEFVEVWQVRKAAEIIAEAITRF